MANTPVVSTDLLVRLEAFDIDGPPPRPTLTFAARLARENGWTRPYAERVVQEYKRFVYLMAAAGHPVTPSEQVDQAWHLHLTYTQSYWTRLCGEIVGRPLHHNPTRGGEAEDEKFDGWYERTLQAYELAFGHPPPADIWPPASKRFGEDLDWVRVNRRHSLVLRRGAGLLAAGALVAAGAMLGGVPSLSARIQAAGTSSGSISPVLVIGGFVALILILLLLARGARRGDAGGCGGGCTVSTGGCGSDSSGGCASAGCGGGDGGGGGCGGGGCGGGGCGGGCGS